MMKGIQDFWQMWHRVKLVSVLICIALVISCNNANDKKKGAAPGSVPLTVDSVPVSTVDSVPPNIQVDSVIHLAFAPGNNAISVKGSLDKRGDPVICYLRVAQGKTLTASVAAENEKATIRFSHIYLPDGSSDGPFGQNLKYTLQQQGVYRIYIGPNKMAGDPAGTVFNLHVKIE